MTLTPPAARQRTTNNRNRFDQELDAMAEMLDGQLLVSQEQCVDALLDLYNVAPTTLLCELIGEMISDIRYVSAVLVQQLRRDLSTLTQYLAAPGQSTPPGVSTAG